MNLLLRPFKKETGFTLIEVVIMIIVVSIFGSMLVQFMYAGGPAGSGLMRASESIDMVKGGFTLSGIMEKITKDYKKLLSDNAGAPLQSLQSYVENGNNPENTPYYGEYLWETKYIIFDENQIEEADPCTSDCATLKIILKKDEQSISLPALFTRH